MAESINCVATIRHDAWVYILDGASGKGFEHRGFQLGPMTEPLNHEEYESRRRAAVESGDARLMFDRPEQYEVFSDGEISAYTDYLCHELGGLAFAELTEHEIVIAYESRRTLPAETVAA